MRFKPNKCECRKCQRACETRPCWPAPSEAAKLQAAYPQGWVYEQSAHHLGRAIRVIRPRAVDETPGATYDARVSPCSFYRDGKCALHYSGFKPMEGRLASHLHDAKTSALLRGQIASLWLMFWARKKD